MNIMIIFQRMLMLLAMMGMGFLCYKKRWLDDVSYKKLSEIVVNIFNPALVINGALSAVSTSGADMDLVLENLMFVAIYFAANIVISIPVAKVLGKDAGQRGIYRLMTIFSNVGFMGIPVISSIYGEGSIIYVTFYILAYNLLLYTYGVFIAQKHLPAEERDNGVKGLFNIGTVCSVLALVLFFSGYKANDTVLRFFDYMGNATIPLSMMVIGVSVAKISFRELFSEVRIYLFAAISLLAMPVLASFLFRALKGNDVIFGVFILMFGLPVGSIVTMIIKKYGGDESLCSKATIITTILSILTIPLVTAFI